MCRSLLEGLIGSEQGPIKVLLLVVHRGFDKDVTVRWNAAISHQSIISETFRGS